MTRRAVVTLGIVFWLAVPAGAEKLVFTPEELRGVIDGFPPELRPADIPVPFDIDAEIQKHVKDLLSGINADREKARRLLTDIFSPQDLNIIYAGYNTKTAGEVFRVRHANCLGYTNLYVGMTRYAGLDSYYVEVNDLDDVKLLAEGKAVLVRGHICAGVRLQEHMELFDFASDVPKKYKQWRLISDREALAAFLNNRGVEAMFKDGDFDREGREEAARLFSAATRVQPGYPPAVNNLASIHLVHREFEAARRLYLSVRGEGKSRATILANLGTTHLLQRQPELALGYYQSALKESRKDPFILEKIGVAQETLGHLEEAIEAFQRAAAYHGRFARPHLALGKLYTRLGDVRRAAREFRLALEIDGESEEARRGLDAVARQAGIRS